MSNSVQSRREVKDLKDRVERWQDGSKFRTDGLGFVLGKKRQKREERVGGGGGLRKVLKVEKRCCGFPESY